MPYSADGGQLRRSKRQSAGALAQQLSEQVPTLLRARLTGIWPGKDSEQAKAA